MKNNNFVMSYSIKELPDVVGRLENLLRSYRVLSFSGDLGAGKTTVIRALLRRLGVNSPIKSPTFNYVNRYSTVGGVDVYHFDLYRIIDQQQFLSLGLEEFLYQLNSLVFIEWPEVIKPMLARGVCSITLEGTSGEERILVVVCE